jgi:sulfide:quinone oxidoreductase
MAGRIRLVEKRNDVTHGEPTRGLAMTHVLILGGGFGGLAAAHELRRALDEGDEITLIASSDRFYIGFAKLWDLAGVRPLEEGTGRLERLDEHGIRYVQADVTAVDPETRTVETSAGTFSGDALLVALGAADAPGHTSQLGGAAHNLYDGEALPEMREALARLHGGRLVVSILGGPLKCPPAPYEAILLVDEHLRERGVRDDVELVITTPQPMTLPVAGPDASRFVADQLEDRGILLRDRHKVTTIDAEADTLHFDDGSELGYSVLFAVPATVPHPVLAESPLAGPSGWIEPDPRSFQTSFARVYAVGDCTMVPTAGGQLPKAGVFAEGGGRIAARNIAADLTGSERASFDGHGYCFLELPDRQVAYVEGDFYAEPEPDVEISPASTERFDEKQAFERERLEAWFG